MTNIGTIHGPSSGFSTGDTRRGYGYGSTVSNKTGLGREHNMGDALSSPIGPHDDVENRMFEDQDEDVDVEQSDIGMHNKMLGSLSKGTDPHAQKSSDPGYLGDMAARTPIAASHYRKGNSLLKEFIREALNEVTCMSVRVMVKGSVGDTYKPSKASVSNVNQMSPGDPSIKQKGYGQRVGTKDMYPYVKAGKPTTDGAETMRRLNTNIEDEFEWNNSDYTTSDYLLDTMDQEYLDWANVRSHIKKFK